MMMKDAERNEDLLSLNPQAGLGRLADQTGGFMIRDTNDARAGFRQIAQDMRFHYVLGYTPTNQDYDGRFRKVSVKLVRRSGLEVQSRKGYFALKPGGTTPILPYEAPVVALLDRGGPAAQAFPLHTTALVFPAAGANSQVPVLVQVPGTAVKYVPDPSQKDVLAADLAVVVRIRNEFQQEVSRLSQHFQLSTPAAKLKNAQGGDILFYRQADLPAGRYTAQAIAYDATAKAASLKTFNLEVPPASGASLSTLVIISRIEKVSTSERDPRNPLYYGDAIVYPSMGEPFSKSVTKALGFFFSARDPQPGQRAVLEVAKSGQLVGQLPLDLPAPNADGVIQSAGALPLANFAPGDYELRLSLLSGSQKLASRTAPFTVTE